MPNLNCMLLSVAKLLKRTSYLAIFSDTLCVLQDRFTRTLIEASEERDHVYFYCDVTITRGYRVKATEDQSSWHHRLGHSAYGVLRFLYFITSVNHILDKFGRCDIFFSV